MLCGLPTYYLWSLNLLIHVPFQLSFLEHTALSAISALGTSRTPSLSYQYSFTPEWSEARESKVPCPWTQHRDNVPILWREKHDISLKILHQAGFETALQAVTLAKLRALAIAPRPNNWVLTLNPSTAGAVHFCFLHFYQHITYQLLNPVNIKSDNNQQDLKFVEHHFVKSK